MNNDISKKKNSSILAFSGQTTNESGTLGGAARAKPDKLDFSGIGESPLKSSYT